VKIGAHILIVEDNESFRDLVREVFTDHGFQVSEAANGLEGLAVMERAPIDLAIVDLEMPLMNGLDFTKHIKAKNPHFPVIMVTAYAAFHSPAEILEANVDAFLQKPVPMDKLLKVVEQL
jgi:CheY-like chemotaxis protein